MLCCLAIEKALSKEYTMVRYAAPTARQVQKIILPLMRQILDDCPEKLKPKYKSQESVYIFPNGSEIHIAGCDLEGAERLRGTATDLALIDEAGFVDKLEYVVKDILMPQTLTTGGRIIMASTPSNTPDHAFHVYDTEAMEQDAHVHMTIHDNPMVKEEQIVEYMKESGGKDSTTWKREYLAEFVTDEEYAVVPEFNKEAEAEIVVEVPIPSHRDCYVSLDVGFHDLSACLFGYWDFVDARLVVEDELVMNKMTSEILIDGIKEKEKELWGDQKPLVRVLDADDVVVADINRTHRFSFSKTAKDNKEAAINALRLIVKARKLVIHPRCKVTIAHLRNAVWNKSRTSFERSSDHGHFDCVDALVYMVRNLRKGKNPFPDERLTKDRLTHFIDYSTIGPSTLARKLHFAILGSQPRRRFAKRK